MIGLGHALGRLSAATNTGAVHLPPHLPLFPTLLLLLSMPVLFVQALPFCFFLTPRVFGDGLGVPVFASCGPSSRPWALCSSFAIHSPPLLKSAEAVRVVGSMWKGSGTHSGRKGGCVCGARAGLREGAGGARLSSLWRLLFFSGAMARHAFTPREAHSANAVSPLSCTSAWAAGRRAIEQTTKAKKGATSRTRVVFAPCPAQAKLACCKGGCGVCSCCPCICVRMSPKEGGEERVCREETPSQLVHLFLLALFSAASAASGAHTSQRLCPQHDVCQGSATARCIAAVTRELGVEERVTHVGRRVLLPSVLQRLLGLSLMALRKRRVWRRCASERPGRRSRGDLEERVGELNEVRRR